MTQMRYLIKTDLATFYTDWFTVENNYHEGMTVFDLRKDLYTTDGVNWIEIEEDHL